MELFVLDALDVLGGGGGGGDSHDGMFLAELGALDSIGAAPDADVDALLDLDHVLQRRQRTHNARLVRAALRKRERDADAAVAAKAAAEAEAEAAAGRDPTCSVYAVDKPFLRPRGRSSCIRAQTQLDPVKGNM